ncbi:lipoprotein insertase outer membrane protein LolB [Erwinia pyrifoliae]|uniref:Outer-membrane lipoprotein LolB n=1 Tax=Erwinia pyrifoliae TaxID=79967 RepID=A0ABY5XD19_ERWPY|nr:lipoprotein insertase outer membrane protein LolB [Erwinia pyrifoliae]AUX72555.1 lipoprotein localization protein LolB [Erwinia pyrifoliae]MCA8877189.1 lipoprotein localization protein LolB [Erwinia pyrifoliae]MCT2387371.1 lipoprotein insertase outer membrane protein LolB [Erwinia pyrifoliae]MCU8587029.1 lipoprotein insertase outer membrane protein LolB [Erwinia pyrifoliae]UWS30896.1 lipoprotein insertase outer membrane protein LolB [Erwinia pyrifoliae]
MLSSNRRLLRLLPLASLLLTACGLHTQPQKPGQSPTAAQWHQHQQAVEKITQYQTRGAFAWLSDRQKVYARFNWQQTAPDRYRLLLTNPLGSTELQLDQQGQVAQIVDNKGKRYVSNDAAQMISQLTGMTIPLNNLRQWMMGLPGDATDFQLDDQYRLREVNFSEEGKRWHVTYQAYHNEQNPQLPASIELQQGDQRIKLKMDSWTLK